MESAAVVNRTHPLVEFFAVVVRPRTYGSLLYLWLAFPLGLVYFVGLTVGFSAGIPLTIVWVGLLVLFVTLAGAWFAEGFERQLAIRLLGAAVPARLPAAAAAASPIDPTLPVKRFATVRQIGGSSTLWKGLFFLFLKFPLGLAGWIISLVLLSVSLAFLATPIAMLFANGGATIDIDFAVWQPTTFVETLPIALLGAFGLLLTLHLQNAFGWVWARLAELLLGSGQVPASSSPAPSPVAA